MEISKMNENPVCDKCGNEYDPSIIQAERTLFLPEGLLSQWRCDKCGNYVDLKKFDITGEM
jgi:predicted nucleic-acid-binding Zn-ribbon protein